MADKQISELTSASAMTDGSLFVIEQGGAAKSANWSMMKNYISPGVAAQYSSSATYNVGDYAIYNGQLYRCTTAISTAESWTAAHWTAAVLGDDVCDLKNALSPIHTIIIKPEVSGVYIDNTNGNAVEYAGWSATNYIDLLNVEYIYVSNSLEQVIFNAFYDENKQFISYFLTSAELIKVPANARYMRLSHHTYKFNGYRAYYVPFEQLKKAVSAINTIFAIPYYNNKYVETNGVLTDYAGWSATDYIDISNVDKIFVSNSLEAQAYNCFYDENKNFISNFVVPVIQAQVIVPTNAKYMMLSHHTEKFKAYKLFYEPFDSRKYLYDHQISLIPTIDGKYIETNGVFTDYNDWSISQKIDVSDIDTLHITFPLEALPYNAFYDKNDVYIKNFTVGTTETVIQVPSSAAYALISNHPIRFPDILITFEPYPVKKYNKFRSFPKVKGISRLGIQTNAPEQSIASYKAAVEAGFEILLCDLEFTADNVPVCVHDPSINRVARNADGTTIDTNKRVDSLTLAQINTYDFGIAKGQEFAGLKVLQLKDFLMFCKLCGVQAYIEIKLGTRAQIQSAVELVEAYGMIDSVSWAGWFEDASHNVVRHADWVVEKNSTCRVGLMSNGLGITASTGYKDHLLGLKTGHNSVFCFNWNTETVTDDEVEWLRENDIDFEIGIINTRQGIIDYLNGTNHYIVNGIESDYLNAPTVLKEYALSADYPPA